MSGERRWKVIPESLQQAAMWFTLAVIAGIAETVISVIDGLLIDTDAYSGAEIAINVAFRAVVYGSVLVIIQYLRRGYRWPSLALTVLLGVLGIGSLVVPYVMWLADGNSVMAGMRGLDTVGIVFTIVRVAHIAFVLLGLIYLYASPSRRYYRRGGVSAAA